MGIQSMLSNAPKRLLALKLDGMTTLEQCSKMENFVSSVCFIHKISSVKHKHALDETE